MCQPQEAKEMKGGRVSRSGFSRKVCIQWPLRCLLKPTHRRNILFYLSLKRKWADISWTSRSASPSPEEALPPSPSTALPLTHCGHIALLSWKVHWFQHLLVLLYKRKPIIEKYISIAKSEHKCHWSCVPVCCAQPTQKSMHPKESTLVYSL